MCCNAFCINLKKKKKVITHQIRDFNHYFLCDVYFNIFGGSFMAHSIIPVIPADK